MSRIPRKLKKKSKKEGLYSDGIAWDLCLICQNRIACCGYGLYSCKKCWEEPSEELKKATIMKGRSTT